MDSNRKDVQQSVTFGFLLKTNISLCFDLTEAIFDDSSMKNQKKPKITKKTLKGTKKTNKTNISDTYRLKVLVREPPKQKKILVFNKKPKVTDRCTSLLSESISY